MSKIMLEIRNDGIRANTEDANGMQQTKIISLIQLRELLTRNMRFNTGVLPLGTRYYSRSTSSEFLFMEHPSGIKHVKWADGKQYDIPVPWTLWAIHLDITDTGRKHRWSHVYAMDRPLLSPELSYVYKFPFCNVSGYICWGNTRLPRWDDILGLQSFPDLFFTSAPFNGDLDGNYEPFKNDAGYKIYGTHSLFRHLDGATEFPYEILADKHKFSEALYFCQRKGRV